MECAYLALVLAGGRKIYRRKVKLCSGLDIYSST